mgnify:CR=1 FL=1
MSKQEGRVEECGTRMSLNIWSVLERETDRLNGGLPRILMFIIGLGQQLFLVIGNVVMFKYIMQMLFCERKISI